MQILFTKVVHFTKLIKAGGRLREFNIRKLKHSDNELFSIDTVDDRGNRIIFLAEKNGGAWHIQPTDIPLPSWVSEVESKIGDAIEEELRQI
ncbi:MAG: hypothetical protein ABIR18_14725 [Chitinophagaceae bacterium]